MQFKKTILRLSLILFPVFTFSQSTYLPQGDKAYILLERLEIKARTDSALNFSKTRPFSRQDAYNSNIYLPLLEKGVRLSNVDAYNATSLERNNLEWATPFRQSEYKSKKPILKAFYKTPANLYEVHIRDFDLVLNPVFQYVI
jgi:hypothetical protein